jgi:hypothetical protein
VALWLDVASGDTGAALTPAHYRRVAERLGRAQGVASRADRPWSRGFLAAYLTSWNDVGWERVFDDDAWNRPLIRAHFSDDLRHALVQLPELDAAATAGYWDGLRAAGWRGTYDDMRLGICLMGAKWAWLTPHRLRLAEREHHRVYGGERADADHLFHERARVLRFNVELADEARARAASR